MKLKCLLRNGTAHTFETSPIATNDSRLYITTPDGQRLPWFRSKLVRPIIVAVGATEEWELPLGDLFGLLKLDKAGVYTIVWEIGSLRSNIASIYVPKH